MKRIVSLIELFLFFAKEVLLSNLKVARDALSPKPKIEPGFVSIELAPLSDRQLFVLANMITMTPGTLSLEFSHDKRSLTLHTLYANTAANLQNDITQNYERRVLNAF